MEALRAYYTARERKCQESMDEQKKTRRERIDAALDAMGAAVETAKFSINAYKNGRISVHFLTGRDVLSDMAACPGAVVAFERVKGGSLTFRRSVAIGDVEFCQYLYKEEAALYGIF